AKTCSRGSGSAPGSSDSHRSRHEGSVGDMNPQVICLPGGVAPAAQRYGPLRAAVGDDADLYMKDLEVYREAKPSSGYSVEVELEAIDTFAAEHNLERFH